LAIDNSKSKGLSLKFDLARVRFKEGEKEKIRNRVEKNVYITNL